MNNDIVNCHAAILYNTYAYGTCETQSTNYTEIKKEWYKLTEQRKAALENEN